MYMNFGMCQLISNSYHDPITSSDGQFFKKKVIFMQIITTFLHSARQSTEGGGTGRKLLATAGPPRSTPCVRKSMTFPFLRGNGNCWRRILSNSKPF